MNGLKLFSIFVLNEIILICLYMVILVQEMQDVEFRKEDFKKKLIISFWKLGNMTERWC